MSDHTSESQSVVTATFHNHICITKFNHFLNTPTSPNPELEPSQLSLAQRDTNLAFGSDIEQGPLPLSQLKDKIKFTKKKITKYQKWGGQPLNI